MPKLIYILAIFTTALLITCCDAPVQELKGTDPDPVPEQFVRANQYMYQRHQDHISAFIDRTGWKAEITPSGLWIVIEKPGTGPSINDNSLLTFAFESTLLDGTPWIRGEIHSTDFGRQLEVSSPETRESRFSTGNGPESEWPTPIWLLYRRARVRKSKSKAFGNLPHEIPGFLAMINGYSTSGVRSNVAFLTRPSSPSRRWTPLTNRASTCAGASKILERFRYGTPRWSIRISSRFNGMSVPRRAGET